MTATGSKPEPEVGFEYIVSPKPVSDQLLDWTIRGDSAGGPTEGGDAQQPEGCYWRRARSIASAIA